MAIRGMERRLTSADGKPRFNRWPSGWTELTMSGTVRRAYLLNLFDEIEMLKGAVLRSKNAGQRDAIIPLMREEESARETTDWILGFMENECSLLPECVSAADRSNIANAILNVLRQRADEAFEDAARLVEEWAADNDPNSRALAAAIRARITPKGQP